MTFFLKEQSWHQSLKLQSSNLEGVTKHEKTNFNSDLFWSVTRYGADTFLPLNPADIGDNDIQAYNAFNTKPDEDGNVTFTFSVEDPKDGTYWMPVMESGYYIIFRYYGPTQRLNGNTAKDIIFKGTKLEEKFKTVKF
jgi:hypothetical protein